MSEWWTYRLSDLLMFSPATYRRMLALYNADLWPLQLVTLAVGVAIFAALFYGRALPSRVVSGVLAACWLHLGWAFHWERYASINTAAPYFAMAFAFEAAVLAWFGVVAGTLRFGVDGSVRSRMALAGLLLALAYPAFGALAGREFAALETFGVAPDPTALVTLALLSLARGRGSAAASVVPLAWCAVSAATLWTMQAVEAWWLLAAIALTVPLLALRRHDAAAR